MLPRPAFSPPGTVGASAILRKVDSDVVVAEFGDGFRLIAIAQIGLDRLALLVMVGEVACGQGELLHRCELTFNRVEPGAVVGREQKAHIVLACPVQHFLFLVAAPIVQDNVEPDSCRIAAAEAFEKGQDLRPPLIGSLPTPQMIRLTIISRQQVAGSVGTSIGGRQALDLLMRRPTDAVMWTDLQGAELIKGDHPPGGFERGLPRNLDPLFFRT